ncbi:MAG TPA: hypothetical protein VGD41_20630, partial [Pyrinomonadaceae bacterium]
QIFANKSNDFHGGNLPPWKRPLSGSMGRYAPRVRDGFGGAPWQGGAFQWVQVPPGKRSSRKQSEQSWR